MAHRARRLDVPVGKVPDYATFLRHIWDYEDEDVGSVIGDPPWMFSILFEDPTEVGMVFSVIDSLVSARKPAVDARHIEVLTGEGERGAEKSYTIRFANLSALHSFMVELAAQATVDVVARQVGEFLMWTLGFRWV